MGIWTVGDMRFSSSSSSWIVIGQSHIQKKNATYNQLVPDSDDDDDDRDQESSSSLRSSFHNITMVVNTPPTDPVLVATTTEKSSNETEPSKAVPTPAEMQGSSSSINSNVPSSQPQPPQTNHSQQQQVQHQRLCNTRIQQKRIPGAAVRNDTMVQGRVFSSKNYGNTLSPYWAARSVAQLAGLKYRGRAFVGTGTFMEYLPQTAPGAVLPDDDAALDDVLCRCPQRDFEFFHECVYGWAAIHETIRDDTRSALLAYASRQSAGDRAQALGHMFQKDDWLIYEVCM